ncbi:MAG: IS21 family transposase [Nitrospiria bacterium]
MVGVEERERIRRAYYVEKKGIKRIARELGHGRKVVRKAIKESGIPVYQRKQPVSLPVLGPYLPIIQQWLADDENQPRKQRHTASRVYHRLKEEYGFTGCESNVRRYVGLLKPKLTEVFTPIEHLVGKEAQVDFGEAKVMLAGVLTTVHLFCFQLCHSTRRFVRAYRTEKQESFFDGMARAFRVIGGVPSIITFDNPKTIVKKVFRGHVREEHPDFIAFRSHYLFEGNFCNPAKGNEKGHVEGLVGCVRRNALVPLPDVGSMEEINEILFNWCEKDLERDYKGKRVSEWFAQELPTLKPLPPFDYSCCRHLSFCVGRYSEIRVGTNRYSVPVAYAHRMVSVKAYPERVEIFSQGVQIASHSRSYEQNQDILDPYHYVPLLERRPALLDHGKAFQTWRLPEIFEQVREGLKTRKAHPEREYIRILLLHGKYTTEQIAEALKKAEGLGCLGADEVEMLLLQQHRPFREPSDSFQLDLNPALSSLKVETGNLQRYNTLAEVAP